MENVNDRYNVIEEYPSRKELISRCLVEDTYVANRRLMLNFIDGKLFNSEAYQSLLGIFPYLAKLSPNFFLRPISLERVKSVDHAREFNEFLLYTTEVKENGESFSEWIKERSISDIAIAILALLKGFQDALFYGFEYYAFSFSNIIAVNDKGFKFYHNDIISSEIVILLSAGETTSEYFRNFSLKKIPDKIDFHKLAAMFLSIVERKQEVEFGDLLARLGSYRSRLDFAKKNKNLVDHMRILDFLDKLHYGYFDPEYINFHKIITYFSQSLGLKQSTPMRREKLSLNAFLPLIGRRNELNKVMSQALGSEKSENVPAIILHGALGVGKTRFLNEIKKRLDLRGAWVLSSPTSDLFNGKLLGGLLEIVQEASLMERRRGNYQRLIYLREQLEEIRRGNQEDDFIEAIRKVLLLLTELLGRGRLVFLLDDFGSANSEIMEFMVTMLQDRVLSTRSLFVCVVNDGDEFSNLDLRRFLHTIKQMSEVLSINFTELSEKYFKIFMSALLANVHQNTELYDAVWKHTSGNPQKIVTFLNRCLLNGSLYMDETTGRWYFSNTTVEKKGFFEGESIRLQLEELSDRERVTLFVIASVEGEIEGKKLCSILRINDSTLFSYTDRLSDGYFIDMRFDGFRRFFKIRSEEVREQVMKEVPESVRNKTHEKILESLDISDEDNLIESISQLEKLGDHSRAIDNIHILIGRYREKDLKKTMAYYDKVIKLMKGASADDKLALVLEMANVYALFQMLEEALALLEEKKYLYSVVKRPGLKELMLFRIAQYLFYKMDTSSRQRYIIRGFKDIPQKERTSRYEVFLNYIQANYHITLGEIDSGLAIYEDIIKKHRGNKDYDLVIGDVFRFYALELERKDAHNEADCQAVIRYFVESIKCCSKVKDMRGAYSSALDVAAVYRDTKYEYKKAIELLEELILRAGKSGVASFEALLHREISDAYNYMRDFEKAILHLNIANRKTDMLGISWMRPEIHQNILITYLSAGYFVEFRDFYNANKVEFDRNENEPVLGQLIHDLLANYYLFLGNFGRSQNCIYKAMRITNSNVGGIYEEERFLRYAMMKSLGQREFDVYRLISYLDFISRKMPTPFVNQPFLRIACNITLRLISRLKHSELAMAIDKILALLNRPMTDLFQSYAYFFKALLYPDNLERRLFYLQKALMKEKEKKIKFYNVNAAYAQSYTEIKMTIRRHPVFLMIQLETAKILISFGHKMHAIHQLLEALSEVFHMLRHVPVKYRVSFVNTYGLQELFFYCRIYILEDKNVLNRKKSDPIVSKQLFNVLNDMEMQLVQNKEFLSNVAKFRLSQLDYSNNAEDIVKLFDSRRKRNIDILLRFFMIKLLASEAYLICGKSGGALEIFSYCNEHTSVAARYSFDYEKERTKMLNIQVLMRSINRYGITVMSGEEIIPEYPEIHDLISYPIDASLGRRKGSDYYYMIFVSDFVINRFSELANNYQFIEGVLMTNLLSGYILKTSVSVDSLTGALTRAYLDEELLKFSRSVKNGRQGAVMILDLDKFKNVNDTYGHQAGDLVLSTVIEEVLKISDGAALVGRYGGEEFAVVYPEASSDDAFDFSETIRKTVEKIKFHGYAELSITVSIGIAVFSGGEDFSTKEIIKMADTALYTAKQSGRNRSIVYNPSVMKNSSQVMPTHITITNGDDTRIFDLLVGTLLLKSKSYPLEDKILILLKRVISVMEADDGGVVVIEDEKRTYYSKLKSDNQLTNASLISEDEFMEVLQRGSAHMVDWDNYEKRDPLTKLPEWKSFVGALIEIGGITKGVIYLRAQYTKRAFTMEDVKVLETLSKIAATII